MKKASWLSIALLGSAAVCAAQSKPAPTPVAGAAGTSDVSPSMANRSGMQLASGTVTEYKPGERIAFKVDRNTVITLDLDRNVRVDGMVAEGQLAAVMWMGEAGGKRRVTSITAAPGPGDTGTASLASGYQTMDATQGKGAVTPVAGAPTPKAGAATPRATPSSRPPTPTPKP